MVRKDWGGRVSVALVYPNTYAVGMSNLGFQTIYTHLNRLPDVVCERVFFPDPEDIDEYAAPAPRPSRLESLRPLRDFDLVGFSVTYEGDYINAVRLLAWPASPLRAVGADGRRSRRADGRGVRLLEPRAHGAVHGLRGGRGRRGGRRGDRRSVPAERRARRTTAGAGASSTASPRSPASTCRDAFRVRYAADGTDRGDGRRAIRGAPATIVKRRLADVNRFETRSTLRSPRAEYGHMELLEVGKGCGRGCRFCLEGQVYRPVRHRSLDSLRESVAQIAKESQAGRPGRRLRVRLSVDRRPHEGARGVRGGGVDLLPPGRQPHRGAGRLARSGAGTAR